MKVRNILFSAAMALVLFSAIANHAAVGFVPGYEAQASSDIEGRAFVTFEEVAENPFEDGTFQSQFEQYAADSIPMKDLLVVSNASLQRLGISSAAVMFGYDVYPTFFGSEYYSSQKLQRILPAPTQIPKDDSRSMKNLDAWCSTINETAESHPGTRFVMAVVPQVRQDETNPVYGYTHSKDLIDEAWIEQAWGSRLSSAISFKVDGMADVDELTTQWFSTDHHWTLERALRTYNDIGSQLNWAEITYGSNEIIEVTPKWYGSDARRALDLEYSSTMFDQADDFSSLSYYHIKDGMRVDEPFELGKRDAFLAGSIGQKDISLYSAYTDYYGNGSAWIENAEQRNGKTCLLISDSYGYNIRRYIALNYETTITLFPGNGHVDHTIDWYIDEYDVDDVVMLSHAQSFDFIAKESPAFLANEDR